MDDEQYMLGGGGHSLGTYMNSGAPCANGGVGGHSLGTYYEK